ncbi:MAG: triose-phosphate isomerase [Tepidisphaeraceae bacterium]|jgi:triosephosphate isomerase
MKRTPFVAGNWKMNTSRATAVDLAKSVAKGLPQGVSVGIAPPFVYLEAVAGVISGSALLLGAQDVYFEKNGAFTGEISVEMLKDFNVEFVLTGHSERRHVLLEPAALIAKKAAAVYAGGLVLIHCVGEKLEQRDAGKTFQVVQSQLEELSPTAISDPERLVIAYEPVWAIGTGRNATDAQAQEVHQFIRQSLAKRWHSDFADRVRIQYGGSVKPDNARALLAQPDVDGALVGGASLKADGFLAIAASTSSGQASPTGSGQGGSGPASA